ncbi:MAG TPA: DUF4365 domain-containing protein [Terracidiphilus sp.]
MLAELFLQDLEPSYLGRPNSDIGFDFLIGFNNANGGVNTFGVEVKETEQFGSSSFPLDKHAYRRFANSNVPTFLLVVDVKKNRLFYAWPENGKGSGTHSRIKVPVVEVNDRTKVLLRNKLIQ